MDSECRGSDLIGLNAGIVFKETQDPGLRRTLKALFESTDSTLNADGATMRSSVLETTAMPTTESIRSARLGALDGPQAP